MAIRLDTTEGRAIYQQRKAIIEPVFAQLFARFGRTLNYRGEMVDTQNAALWLSWEPRPGGNPSQRSAAGLGLVLSLPGDS